MIAEKASLILTGLHVYNLVNDIFYSTPRESYVFWKDAVGFSPEPKSENQWQYSYYTLQLSY